MATKSYQNHELILTERLRRQEKAVIAAARRTCGGVKYGTLDDILKDIAGQQLCLIALNETTAKLRALKRAKKTGLQAGRP